MNDVTLILNAIEQGDARAADKLLPLVYEELRILAAQKMSQEKPGLTLHATALVHEAYLRLVGKENKGWENRGHFFAAAAEAMRRILIEDARRKKNQRRGGGYNRVTLNESLVSKDKTISPDDLLALNEALEKFEGEDKTKAELVSEYLKLQPSVTGRMPAHGSELRSWARQKSPIRQIFWDFFIFCEGLHLILSHCKRKKKKSGI
jgi:RNA polymerase sigma factor (TIGR02999 family)